MEVQYNNNNNYYYQYFSFCVEKNQKLGNTKIIQLYGDQELNCKITFMSTLIIEPIHAY